MDKTSLTEMLLSKYKIEDENEISKKEENQKKDIENEQSYIEKNEDLSIFNTLFNNMKRKHDKISSRVEEQGEFFSDVDRAISRLNKKFKQNEDSEDDSDDDDSNDNGNENEKEKPYVEISKKDNDKKFVDCIYHCPIFSFVEEKTDLSDQNENQIVEKDSNENQIVEKDSNENQIAEKNDLKKDEKQSIITESENVENKENNLGKIKIVAKFLEFFNPDFTKDDKSIKTLLNEYNFKFNIENEKISFDFGKMVIDKIFDTIKFSKKGIKFLHDTLDMENASTYYPNFITERLSTTVVYRWIDTVFSYFNIRNLDRHFSNKEADKQAKLFRKFSLSTNDKNLSRDMVPICFVALPLIIQYHPLMLEKKYHRQFGSKVVKTKFEPKGWMNPAGLLIKTEYIEIFQGTTFNRHLIPQFEEMKSMKEIEFNKCLWFLSDGEKIKQDIINQSKIVLDYGLGNYFVKLNDATLIHESWSIITYEDSGRAMIDHFYFLKERENISDNQEIAIFKTKNDQSEKKYREKYEQDLYQICPFLGIYSFEKKSWFKIFLDPKTFGPVQFKKDTIDFLVVPETTKYLLKSIVSTSTDKTTQFDVIEGKGNGSIILLTGPPGVGKTLSAESVSESLEKPLYYITTGELGTKSNVIERTLGNVFDLMKRWDAVALIDEADVFLAKRDNDIKRNSVVAAFLKALEYYEGVMFLTTNRREDFDDAFMSRILIKMHYDDLDVDTQSCIIQSLMKKLWGIDQYQIINIKEALMIRQEKIGEFKRLNGRIIKNIFQMIHKTAIYDKIDPKKMSLNQIMDKFAIFSNFH